MTSAIESKVKRPGQRTKHRWSPYMDRDQVLTGRSMKPANDAEYDVRETQQEMAYSRHTHYDPQQVAIEAGLDGWARHATASNGFGDLP